VVVKFAPLGAAKALISSYGDELNEFAGFRLTRLTATASVDDVAVVVETTYQWPSAGRFYMAGVRYAYTGKTTTTFTGLTPAIQEDLPPMTPLADGSQTYSDLDRARQSLLVDFAEGDYLDTLGRNYGVFRFPGLSDDQYRAAIKALAFMSKGTIFSIETLLTHLIGAGNFEIFEDLVNFPDIIFITIVPAVTGTDSIGSSFFNAREEDPSTSTTTVDLDYPVAGADVDNVQAIYLAPEIHEAHFDVKPSSEPDTPWTYTGTQAEATAVTLNGDGSARLQDTSVVSVGARYFRSIRATSTSNIYAVATVRRIAASTNIALGLRVDDGTKILAIGWNGTQVGLLNTSGSAFVGTPFALDTAAHTVELRRISDRDGASAGLVELRVDGVLVTTAAYSSFSASTARGVSFGTFSLVSTADSHWADVAVYTQDENTNYWNQYVGLNDGSVNTATPARLFSAAVGFSATFSADRPLLVSGGSTNHGSNNGRYRVTTVNGGGASVDLEGIEYAEVAVLTADTVQIPSGHVDPFTAEDAGLQASRTTGSGLAGLVWKARYGGVDGNAILTDINATLANQPLSVTVTAGPTITVELATTAGVPTSTAAAVKAAIEANPSAAALVDIEFVQSPGSGVMTVVALAALTGGEDGKFFVIANALNAGNNGTRMLATRIDARTARLGSHLSPAGLLAETAGSMAWRKNPNFKTELNLEWELFGSGTIASQTLTFQRALYASPLTLQILYKTLLTGTILENEFSIDSDPPQAFFLADPFAFIRRLVDAITVAGVIPMFR